METYQKLEQDWASFNQLDPAGMVACSSGTAALHLALEAFQLPQGSEVIVPDFTMIAVPRAVIMAGLAPVFVDCCDDLNMDFPLLYKKWDHINTALVRGIKAVITAHMYGRKMEMDTVTRFCSSAMQGADGLRVIEDLAEAHGVSPNPLTDAACWSFYKNKIVAGEEGGAVWFRDSNRAALARQLRSLGFTDAHDFTHVPRGHNYRLSNAHAWLVLKSLRAAKHNIACRHAVEYMLNEWCPKEWRMPVRNAPWVYDFRIQNMTSADQTKVVEALKATGIAARHAFKPMSHQLEFLKSKRIDTGKHFAGVAAREVVYIPLDRAYDTDPFDTVREALS